MAAAAEFHGCEELPGAMLVYQRFVADYATVATPLPNLMWKKAVWKWGEEEERAFQALKVRLLQYPVLTVPNFKLPMILQTDASDVGVGAALSQKIRRWS